MSEEPQLSVLLFRDCRGVVMPRPAVGHGPRLYLPGSMGDRIAEPDTWPPSVLIDEFDASGLEGSPDHIERGSTWLVRTALELAHGDNADRGPVREILLTPIEKASGGPALIRRDHSGKHA
jgi:hypothetical protein